jgi:hypothetical protein
VPRGRSDYYVGLVEKWLPFTEGDINILSHFSWHTNMETKESKDLKNPNIVNKQYL